MFRTISRLLLPNPLDWKLRKIRNKKSPKILIAWNRGLGDVALGLYAIVYRIREKAPDAKIAFLVRENLRDGFLLLAGVEVLTAPDWVRGTPYSVNKTLKSLKIDLDAFDLILERPSPTDWVRWQRGHLIPRLQWDARNDLLWKKFELQEEEIYIGIQPVAESQYGLWRNWPYERWRELLDRLQALPHVKVLLFGYGDQPQFSHSNVIDLRGKTTLYELISIIKHRCKAVVLPDSGIASMIYYLDVSFPIQLVSLWADPDHGILKQGVFSPNPLLKHSPLIGARRDLSSVSAQQVVDAIFPWEPLAKCVKSSVKTALRKPLAKTGVVILAGGQGSRLGVKGPKGLFPVLNKTLFEWICEKVPPSVPLAIMTSPFNHAETVSFFEKNCNFKREISFFSQAILPLLSEKKKATGMLGPDGNGGVFKELARSGILEKFEKQGIQIISIVPIENPLADPLDPCFLSYLETSNADLIVKCIEESEANPNMGALVQREGRLEIVEYTELDPSRAYRYRYAGMMACTLELAQSLSKIEFPLHWVWKKAKDQFAWKGERFLFDACLFARAAIALCFPRGEIYAPLKSLENLYSVEKILRGKESSDQIPFSVV